MAESVNAFILAAGFGLRLRPITNSIPKPLVPIAGKPLLERILEKVRASVSGEIGINLHYQKETLKEWLEFSPFSDSQIFIEDEILGTGGALKNAEAFLKNKAFVVHNSDIFSDIDISRLISYHKHKGNLVTLAVHDFPKFNNLFLNEAGLLKNVGLPRPEYAQSLVSRAFTGIAVYEPEFLRFLPSGPSSVVDAWLATSASGELVGACDFTGAKWSDIGTPAAYAATVVDFLRTNGETVYFGSETSICSNAEINGFVIAEDESKIGESTKLCNCILLPGAETEARTYHNCIVGPGFELKIKENEFLGMPENTDSVLIGSGGSDRSYFRKGESGRTCVVMKSGVGDADFERHIEYTKFFTSCGVPVPVLVSVDYARKEAVFEDLGDLSLYSWLKCTRQEPDIERMYKKILDALIKIQTDASDRVNECPPLAARIFDYEYFRWETKYFIERFVIGLRGIEPENIDDIENELNRLASLCDSFQKTIIHRDFQSQNIMIMDGKPRIIDYQGARMAPSAYDIASILWDPYYRLPDAVRENLLEYYLSNIKTEMADDVQRSLLSCRLQRHMQALGAYGFLSTVKNKKYFLKHVPEGLRLLKEDIGLSFREYPSLAKLISVL
ncbi:MAG: phosphotransferase [Nitrospirae bacterium]|nr:phosphotransferase [Nitrospirota bacterium]